MKKLFSTVSLLASFLLFGFIYFQQNIDELLQKLNLTKEDAQEYVWSNCSNNAFYHPYVRDLKNLPDNEKAAIVKIVGEFSKAYVNSGAFKERYAQYREDQKPTPPDAPKKMADIKKEQIAQMQKSLSEMENAKAKAPADQKSIYDETIKMLKDQIAELEKGDNDMSSADMDNYMQQGYEEQMKEYNEQLAQWEKEYPAGNNKGMVKAWLKEFLDVSATVDFNAKTRVNQYGKKVFELSQYEEQSYLWKLLYRAGKPATDAGRAFAQQWLKELE